MLAAAWAIYEVGSAAYDIYNAGKTLADSNANSTEKSVAAGGAILSIVAPGGGYGTAGKALTKADDVKRISGVADDVAQRILNKSRPNAQNQELQNVYKQRWRNEDKRAGGTAGELLREVASGGELKHLTKAKGRLNELHSLLSDRSVDMSRLDRKTAEGVMNDLRTAIKAAEDIAK